MEKKYTPCGGCGATEPIDRCIGCFHPFESTPPAEPKIETAIWLNLADYFTEDWEITHCRYAEDKRKLDTDLFELSDGWLVKKGGTGKLELHEVEYMAQAVSQPPAEAERGKEACINVRDKAETWFKEEIEKIDDEERKQEVLLEDETYMSVWTQGYRAGEEAAALQGMGWVKGEIIPIKEDTYFVSYYSGHKGTIRFDPNSEISVDYWKKQIKSYLDESAGEKEVKPPALKLEPGLKFRNVHMPGHTFFIRDIVRASNTCSVLIVNDTHGTQWTERDWNLEHTQWAFEKGEYYLPS